MLATSIGLIVVASGIITLGGGLAALLFPHLFLRLGFQVECHGRSSVLFVRHKEVLNRHCLMLISLVATTWAIPYSLHAQEEKVAPPNLSSILDSLERIEEQNPAQSRPYEVTREYKVFHADEPEPISDVTAQIRFSPPDTKTFTITSAQGNPRGKQIVSAVLEQEVISAEEGHTRDISRFNYDFVFLREQNLGVTEYVLHITPKRKEKGLLLGDIWVDAKSYRIRQIIGVPLKTPSFWIKDLHLTVQFASVNEMWLPVSVHAIATVRFVGIYSLAGQNLVTSVAAASTPGP
jgi:hypothetical protein